jgi:hypothetical protein
MKTLINPDHHAVTTVLGTGAGVDDLGHHHQNTTTVCSMKEPEDPSLPRNTTTVRGLGSYTLVPFSFLLFLLF